MRILSDLTLLTMEEANRCWLKPRQMFDIAKLWDRDANTRTWLNNIVHRGEHIPYEPRISGKVTTRVFSLISCIMLRVMHEWMGRGHSARTAEVVARAAAGMLPLALEYPDLMEFRFAEDEEDAWRVLLVNIPFGANPVKTAVVMPETVTANNLLKCGWCDVTPFFPHHILLRCMETYGEYWEQAREQEAKQRKREARLSSNLPRKVSP